MEAVLQSPETRRVLLMRGVPVLYAHTEHATPNTRSRRGSAEKQSSASPTRRTASRLQLPVYPRRRRDPRAALYSLRRSTKQSKTSVPQFSLIPRPSAPELPSSHVTFPSETESDVPSFSSMHSTKCTIRRPPKCSKSNSVATLPVKCTSQISFTKLDFGTRFVCMRPQSQEAVGVRSERPRQEAKETQPKPPVPEHFVPVRKNNTRNKGNTSGKQRNSATEFDVFGPW